MKIQQFSRAHDEAVLDWLARIEGGESARAIAREYSVNPVTCRRAVRAVWEAMT